MIKKIAILCMMLVPIVSLAQRKKSDKKASSTQKTEQVETTNSTNQENANVLPYATLGSPLLPFTLVTSNEVRITNNMVENGKPVILVLFNPMCDHCQKAAYTMKENINKLKGATILFVCGMNLLGELNKFIETAGIAETPNMHICAAPEEFTNSVFLKKGIPQIMVYNSDHFLKKIMFETFDLEAAINAINQN